MVPCVFPLFCLIVRTVNCSSKYLLAVNDAHQSLLLRLFTSLQNWKFNFRGGKKKSEFQFVQQQLVCLHQDVLTTLHDGDERDCVCKLFGTGNNLTWKAKKSQRWFWWFGPELLSDGSWKRGDVFFAWLWSSKKRCFAKPYFMLRIDEVQRRCFAHDLCQNFVYINLGKGSGMKVQKYPPSCCDCWETFFAFKWKSWKVRQLKVHKLSALCS